MKEIERQREDGTLVRIRSPWLTIDEAATYLGITRNGFIRFAGTGSGMPYKMIGNRKRYHCDVLDDYRPDVAFVSDSAEEDAFFHAYPRRRAAGTDEDLSLVDPVTGKEYRAKPRGKERRRKSQ